VTSHNDESQSSQNANALPDNKYIPIYEVRPVKLPGQPAKKKTRDHVALGNKTRNKLTSLSLIPYLVALSRRSKH
jgi:hypothetical protein